MSTFKVNIKWSKELLKDVELNTNEPPIVFKAQVFALTNVAPERQKIMFKGATLADDQWGNFGKNIKDGVTFMMMGSSEPVPQISTAAAAGEQVKFLEDLNERQLAIELDLPVGLKNLGNTCYLNAVLQCLKTVPELCQMLNVYKTNQGSNTNQLNMFAAAAGGGGDMLNSLVLSLCSTYEYMDKHKINGYAPILLVQLLRTLLPQFSATTENGTYMQQDANECWTELVRILQQKLPPLTETKPATAVATSAKRYANFVDQYFSGEFLSTLKCDESSEEKETINKESFLQLSCFITQDVKYLQTGIKSRLEEKLTKYSETLKRDAVYTKTSKINRLPAYLCIQNVRFFYKEKDKISAKILKDVKFTIQLDLFELCSSELQKKLIPMREKFRVTDDKQAQEARELKKKQLENEASGGGGGSANGSVSKTAATPSSAGIEYASYSFEDDSGSNNSGLYELIAVLTHKGRSSNSGHYVAWCRNMKNSQWMMFDDDEVSPVSEDDILKLSGGGDWHTSYVLLYGPRKLDVNYYNNVLKLQQQEQSTTNNSSSSQEQKQKV